MLDLNSELKPKQKLLILDLDETLIHTTYEPLPNLDLKARRGYFYLYERPYLREFLERCSLEFDLAIWSASKADYVRWIMRSTVLSSFPLVFVNTRRNCKRVYRNDGIIEYQKDLRPYLVRYNKVIMLDDVPKMVIPIENCIKMSEFRGSHETTLKELFL